MSLCGGGRSTRARRPSWIRPAAPSRRSPRSVAATAPPPSRQEGAMTNTQDDTPPSDQPTKNRPKADYDVGYGKPPVAHRFKYGNKANPKGRKKGSRNRKVVIHEVFFEAVTVREGGEIRRMSALEAVLKKMLSKALA